MYWESDNLLALCAVTMSPFLAFNVQHNATRILFLKNTATHMAVCPFSLTLFATSDVRRELQSAPLFPFLLDNYRPTSTC